MRTTIWKFLFYKRANEFGIGIVRMPKDRKILSVQVQNGNACIWAEVDPDSAREDVDFAIIPTGGSLSEAHPNYLGTFQQGAYVWHLYE